MGIHARKNKNSNKKHFDLELHEFKDDFQIERGENFIKFGEIVVKLTK